MTPTPKMTGAYGMREEEEMGHTEHARLRQTATQGSGVKLERYSFTVRCDQTNMLLASGSGYATAPEAEREGRHYAFQYAIGGEPCTLRIRRERPRKRKRVADGPAGQDVAVPSNGTNQNPPTPPPQAP